MRSALEIIVPRRYVDRVLDRLGFFQFKSRFLRTRMRLPDGSEIILRHDEERVIREIYAEGSYDKARISDGDTVVDVGANIGIFSIKAARQTPSGRVVSVEPAPLNLDLLRENVVRNHFDNVTIIEGAVSDHQGEASLFDHGEYGLYSIHQKADRFTPVRLMTLDQIFQREKISLCHVLKIDVEGEEVAVLRGASQALRVTNQVVMEITKINEYPRQCAELLANTGFSCSVEADTPGGILLYAKKI